MMLKVWLRRGLAAFAAILMAVLIAGCSGSGSSTEEMPGVEPAPAVGGDSGAFPQKDGEEDTSGDGDRLVIRSKTLRLEVDSTSDAITEVRDLARTHEGTVSNMQVATGDEWLYHYDERGTLVGDGAALRGWITVRVPTDSYEDFIDAVADIGVVKFQSEATDDVTQEHVDLSARLENMRAQEVRLREFFESAKNVTEMLAIETELGRVRGEIESLDAQVTYLERQAAMATVSVELTEPSAVVRPDGESWGFVEAITSGIRGAAQVVTVTLTVLIATSPLWLAALILFFPVRAWCGVARQLRPRDTRQPPPPVRHRPCLAFWRCGSGHRPAGLLRLWFRRVDRPPSSSFPSIDTRRWPPSSPAILHPFAVDGVLPCRPSADLGRGGHGRGSLGSGCPVPGGSCVGRRGGLRAGHPCEPAANVGARASTGSRPARSAPHVTTWHCPCSMPSLGLLVAPCWQRHAVSGCRFLRRAGFLAGAGLRRRCCTVPVSTALSVSRSSSRAAGGGSLRSARRSISSVRSSRSLTPARRPRPFSPSHHHLER